MQNYIDGFAFPIAHNHLEEYKKVAKQVAAIWKEHGALAYFEYIGEDLELEGTRSFPMTLAAQEDETIIFGWLAFESQDARNLANKKVATDPRMIDLITPLTHPSRIIFDAKRMLYGGFQSFIQL